MALLPPSANNRQTSAESLLPAYSPPSYEEQEDPWRTAGSSSTSLPPNPTLTITVPITASTAATTTIPDTRVNWNTYPGATGSASGTGDGSSPNTYESSPYESRVLTDSEIPMNPSPPTLTRGPYETDPFADTAANPWSTAQSDGISISQSSMSSARPLSPSRPPPPPPVPAPLPPTSSVYGSTSSTSYGRPYWESSTSGNVYEAQPPGSPRPIPPFPVGPEPLPSSQQPAPKPASPPKPRSRDPTIYGNPQTWLILVILLPSAALSGVAWILFADFVANQPDLASTALPLRILSYMAFVSLAMSFFFFAMSAGGDLCCLIPDATVYADGTQRNKRRRAPPMWFADLKLSVAVIFVCAFIGVLIPYCLVAGGPSFLTTTCTQPLTDAYCTQSRAVVGLGAAAGFGWLFFTGWCVWQRRWVLHEGIKMEAARIGI